MKFIAHVYGDLVLGLGLVVHIMKEHNFSRKFLHDSLISNS